MRVGLVLAAGQSRRFGAADKLLAPFRGRPLAGWAADAMRGVALDHRLAVVGSPEVARLFDGYECLPGPGAEAGQADSLRKGVARAHALGATRLLVCLADMPFVGSDVMTAVLAACTEARAAATWDGTVRMPPACFPASDLAGLAALVGDRGAGRLLAKLPEASLIQVATECLADVDRAEDLARLTETRRP
ncbi:nucleotidyltransferase family protein [Tropicimonas sp. TH_r6]|uniref:nucleotidyltransferase family protein n=1 Tax=Tropicimonas sp. TH_r6 TaxID=3082085 RepID=UPI0029542846|nr:nucleotidyltransferase family protein [Tropicimonas sp. TH_r6]MDV7142109.1 nucleotidyltransferase family protein [Tropicimonas sp. TH_r6]